MKIKLLLLLYILTVTIFAVDSRGLLESLEGSNINVGEAYRFRLTLVPFESKLLDKKALVGKRFLDLFYVANVESIEISPNNYDATIVVLDMILTKNAKMNDVYIWQLGDRNIPIEISKITANNVELNIKEFVLFPTPNISFDQKEKFVWLGIIILIILLVLFFRKLKNRKKRPKIEMNYKEFIKEMSSREDLEYLYSERKKILSKIEDESLKRSFEALFNKYSHVQYSRSWPDYDIVPILKEAKDFGRELNDGI